MFSDEEIHAPMVGQRIRRLRSTLNLSQKQLAAKINAAPSNLSEIEAGKSKPGFNVLMRLISTFDVNANWLLLGRGEMFWKPGTEDEVGTFDFGEQTDNVRQMLKLFKSSPLVKISIMAFAQKFLLTHEAIIQLDIQKEKEKKGHEGK
ncbi:MAG: helix-turn-helix transcriptional regulator [bacterium]|nr:helix-turn-helix transcriptional regulator [bacterium]